MRSRGRRGSGHPADTGPGAVVFRTPAEDRRRCRAASRDSAKESGGGRGGGLRLSRGGRTIVQCTTGGSGRLQCPCCMRRDYVKWHSPSLHRDMELLAYGERGFPVVVFATSGGRFYE